ncbi:c-type cytochrome biogenesis protein CcsB, partial [Rhodococcus ruber]|nr:c-type cytochrome biogenesis protein CcsB [Rhodococcus ruber]
TPTGRELSDRLGRMGISVLVVAWILLVGSMVLRGLATARFPCGNMYEFVTVTCAIGVLAGLIVLRRPALRVVW